MQRLARAFLFSFAWLSACANYRGAGQFKTSSEYAAGPSFNSLARTRPTSPFRLSWPVDAVRVNRGFRPAGARNHYGVDLGGALDTPILAAHDGRVIYAGHQFNGYGNMVLIEYDDQWATLYGHLNRIGVVEGGVVRAGQVIGLMGRTGRATGVHLHFELMARRQPVDPQVYLGQRQARL